MAHMREVEASNWRKSDHRRDPRKWRFPWPAALSGLIVLAGVGLFLYPHVAAWFAQKEQSRVIELQLNNWDTVESDDETWRLEQLELAYEYNEALTSGALLQADANVPTGAGKTNEHGTDYWSLLDRTGAGLMARLKYESLGIDLPIYHGTSDATLLKGVGHLQGTSLPVGGEGNRSVLTAHRGLASATLFDNLVDADIGDTFVIEVFGEVLTYQVIETQTVKPEETEAIFAIPGEDLVTLVTCTPLGVNTHRILVTGERILPTPAADLATAGQGPSIPGFPSWLVIIGAVVLCLGVYVWRSGYSPVPTPKEVDSDPEEAADEVSREPH